MMLLLDRAADAILRDQVEMALLPTPYKQTKPMHRKSTRVRHLAPVSLHCCDSAVAAPGLRAAGGGDVRARRVRARVGRAPGGHGRGRL